MQRIIKFDDPLYSRMYWVDMRDVPKELQWKVLEYHNQKFVLDKIVGEAFTEEEHRNFLEHLDEIIETKHRPQYIVYFDGRPVGKYSFTVEENVIPNTGLFLFHEEDQGKGIGLFMKMFFFKYVFEKCKIVSVKDQIYDDNVSQIRLKQLFGEKKLYVEGNKITYENTSSIYGERKASLERILADKLLCSPLGTDPLGLNGYASGFRGNGIFSKV